MKLWAKFVEKHGYQDYAFRVWSLFGIRIADEILHDYQYVSQPWYINFMMFYAFAKAAVTEDEWNLLFTEHHRRIGWSIEIKWLTMEMQKLVRLETLGEIRSITW